MASLFQSCVLLLSCRLYYFSLLEDCPAFFYTAQSIYMLVLPFLINRNEKRCSKSNILAMNHKLVLEDSSAAAAYTLPNAITYLKAIKYLNIRLRQISKLLSAAGRTGLWLIKTCVTLAFRLNFKVIISCRTHWTLAC